MYLFVSSNTHTCRAVPGDDLYLGLGSLFFLFFKTLYQKYLAKLDIWHDIFTKTY